MKRILITGLTITTLLLTGCGNTTNNTSGGGISSNSHGKDYKVKLYTCTHEDLKGGCSESDRDNVGIFKVSPQLCSLSNITDKDEIHLDNITNANNTKLIKFAVDPKSKIINMIVSTKKSNKYTNNNSPKNLDILFDLTYYSTDNKDLENEVISTRKKKLTEELEKSLNPGDKVTLRYIGTIDYGNDGHKNAVLKDIDELKLKGTNTEKIETKYYSLTLRCKPFKRTKTLKIYTHLENKKKERFHNNLEENNIITYNTKDDLVTAILNKINSKYNSGKYSYGTYFLETLSNYEDFLNRKDYSKNDVNIIVSDFKFQLHPIMKKRKNIPSNSNFSFPPEKLNLWNKGTTYYNFYTKTVPTYFDDRCKNNEKLNLVGLETDDIEIKRIMKKYYKDYLFKKCNVEFK